MNDVVCETKKKITQELSVYFSKFEHKKYVHFLSFKSIMRSIKNKSFFGEWLAASENDCQEYSFRCFDSDSSSSK